MITHPVFSLVLSLAFLTTACGRKGREQKPPPVPRVLAPVEFHHTFGVPFESPGVRPADVVVGAPVWALLPYPTDQRRYRLAAGTLVAADDSRAIVENSGSNTGAVPWSAIRPRTKAEVTGGQAVLAAGTTGVFCARVISVDADRAQVERIWRSGSRREEVPSADLIPQTGTRGFGQIIFYHDRGMWHQGVWVHAENRHAWIVGSLGGTVIRVSESETQPWSPTFRPTVGQEVEACRSSASMLVRATIHAAHEHGLFYEIRLSSGATRTSVPFWELLPAGTVL